MTALRLVTCLLEGCGWSVAGKAAATERESRRHAGELPGGPVPAHSVAGQPVHATQRDALDEARAQYQASGRAHEVTYDGTWWHVTAVRT